MENKDKPNKSGQAYPGMTKTELAHYIKEQTGMTWEETAMFILDLSMADIDIQRQLLDKLEDACIPRPLQMLIAIASELGWSFMFEKTKNEHANLNGLIIGNPLYIEEIAGKLKIADDVIKKPKQDESNNLPAESILPRQAATTKEGDSV